MLTSTYQAFFTLLNVELYFDAISLTVV